MWLHEYFVPHNDQISKDLEADWSHHPVGIAFRVGCAVSRKSITKGLRFDPDYSYATQHGVYQCLWR